MQVLGIDIGSSSIKGALLDLEHGTIEHVTQTPFPAPTAGQPPLFYEVDPDSVVASVRSIIHRMLAIAPRCQALFCCTQMGGLVLIDDQRQLRSNYISWRDQRVTSPGADGTDQLRLRERLGGDLIRRLGNEFRPGGTINLLDWLVQHDRLGAGPLMALGLGDYVLMRLCNCEPAAHPTAALGTIDLTTGNGSIEALERIGAVNVAWPRLVDVNTPIGVSNAEGVKLKCFAAVGDHQCALAGAGLHEGELSINISTGSQVSVRTSRLSLGAYQSKQYFDASWLNTVTHLPAGRALNALVDLLTTLASPGTSNNADVWRRIGQAIETTPQTDLQISLAFFPGPAGDRGHMQNMTLENLTVGHLFRAAINNMADNYCAAAESLAPGSNWRQILFSGGLAQKLPGLCHRIAERLGLPSRMGVSVEETHQGLLELARQSLG